MKFYITHIFVLFIFLSCNSTIQEKEKIFSIDEIKIPLIETNKKNRHLKLNNGVLSFREKAYSGIVNEFYVDGNIKSKSEYYQGKRQGFFNGWYRNGSEWFQRFYNNS